MKKIFIWAWLLAGILSAKGQNVALDVAHFPDVTFRNYLKTEFDVNRKHEDNVETKDFTKANDGYDDLTWLTRRSYDRA